MTSTNAFDCFGAEQNAAEDVHGTFIAPKVLRMLIMECNGATKRKVFKAVLPCLRWSEKFYPSTNETNQANGPPPWNIWKNMWRFKNVFHKLFTLTFCFMNEPTNNYWDVGKSLAFALHSKLDGYLGISTIKIFHCLKFGRLTMIIPLARSYHDCQQEKSLLATKFEHKQWYQMLEFIVGVWSTR